MLRLCLTCAKEFDAPIREVNRGNGLYCSRECSSARPVWSKRKATISTLVCAFCHIEFKKQACRVRGGKSGLRFCSRKCKDSAQSLVGGMEEIQPSHFGTGHGGYREKAFSVYPKQCARCGYKEVESILQVHHKDRNRLNRDIGNLEVLCPNCHETEHYLSHDGRWASGVIGSI